MTEGRYNPTKLPAGLDEADLLALVEGEPLASGKAMAAQRALAADPALSRLVAGMKRDREGLRTLGEARAPAGLMAAVESSLQTVLERQMLLGISDGAPIDDRPPVSLVVPQRRSIFSTRRLALAAGLLLLVSGGIFTAATMMSQGTPRRTLGPLARNSQPAEPVFRQTTPERTTALKEAPLTPAGAEELFADKARVEEIEALTALTAAPTETPAHAAMAALADADPEAAGPPVPGPMEADEALRLAAEHRLIVRIVTTDGRVDRITSRLAKPGYTTAWQLAGEAPAALASLLGPEGTPSTPRSVEPPSFAGDGDFAKIAPMGPPAPPAALAPEPTVYILQARMDQPTLDALRKSMRDAGADVVFEEVENPLPMDPGPLTSPGAIVWWGNGAWSPWGSVPIVIQR